MFKILKTFFNMIDSTKSSEIHIKGLIFRFRYRIIDHDLIVFNPHGYVSSRLFLDSNEQSKLFVLNYDNFKEWENVSYNLNDVKDDLKEMTDIELILKYGRDLTDTNILKNINICFDTNIQESDLEMLND